MQKFEQICRDAGIKITDQRQEIYRSLVQTGAHPDSKAVYQ